MEPRIRFIPKTGASWTASSPNGSPAGMDFLLGMMDTIVKSGGRWEVDTPELPVPPEPKPVKARFVRRVKVDEMVSVRSFEDYVFESLDLQLNEVVMEWAYSPVDCSRHYKIGTTIDYQAEEGEFAD